MRCEIVAIGTELLLGQIIDTNSSWIGEQLALNGIDTHFQIKVGDNIERIVEALEHSLARSEAVICCGGLGPTQDDITRDAIATVMGVTLESDQEVERHIREIFESRGRHMPMNNLRQSLIPKGASAIKDQPGTAPGLICPIGNKVLYAVPGVPYELKQIMNSTILPDLVQRSGAKTVIGSRVLRTWGHSESKLAELLENRIQILNTTKTATIAFLASGIEGLKVRITAKAANDAEVETILQHEEQHIRDILGNVIFGIDDDTIESSVITLLEKRRLTIALAEMTSGGLASSRLANVDREGKTFLGGIVPSSPEARHKILGIEPEFIGSNNAAKRLAQAAKSLFSADIGLSITSSHDLEEGTAGGETYLGIAEAGGTIVERVLLPGDRARMGQFSIISLLNGLRLRLT